jgi:DNA gyrase/topoisomerase IV subunit A
MALKTCVIIFLAKPLQAGLVEQIARLVDAGAINGISDVRDESDRDGLRVVVEVKKGKSFAEAYSQETSRI